MALEDLTVIDDGDYLVTEDGHPVLVVESRDVWVLDDGEEVVVIRSEVMVL